jgi:hypothetical protein
LPQISALPTPVILEMLVNMHTHATTCTFWWHSNTTLRYTPQLNSGGCRKANLDFRLVLRRNLKFPNFGNSNSDSDSWKLRPFWSLSTSGKAAATPVWKYHWPAAFLDSKVGHQKWKRFPCEIFAKVFEKVFEKCENPLIPLPPLPLPHLFPFLFLFMSMFIESSLRQSRINLYSIVITHMPFQWKWELVEEFSLGLVVCAGNAIFVICFESLLLF